MIQTPPSSVLCSHAPSYTDRVIMELIETERNYVRDLEDIIKVSTEMPLPGDLLSSTNFLTGIPEAHAITRRQKRDRPAKQPQQ